MFEDEVLEEEEEVGVELVEPDLATVVVAECDG